MVTYRGLRKSSVKLQRGLIQARVDAGMSQRELARRMRRVHTFISKAERGEQHVTVIDFVEWARACGVDPPELLRRVLK